MNVSLLRKAALAFAGLTAIATLTACGPSAVETTIALPSQDSTPEFTPSPTMEMTNPTTIWKLYRNEIRGFSFEYPVIYDEAPYRDSCGLKEEGDGIRLGLRSSLQFFDAGGLSQEEFLSDLLSDKNLSVDSQTAERVNGLEAIKVEHRFGGTNRFGTFTLVKWGGYFYLFEFSAGGFCEIPESPVSEAEAYAHMIETFQFDPTTPDDY